jgi:hypothetical protein
MKFFTAHVAVLCAVFVLFLEASHAQQRPRPGALFQRQRAAGQSGPEGRRLAFLLGAWEEKVTYPGETREQGAKEGTGRWFARPILERYIQLNYQGTGPEGPYRAFGVLGFDRETQSYRLWWFDEQGGVGDYRGNFVDENTLSVEHSGKVEGRDFRERISYIRVSPAQIRTKIEQAWENGEYKVYMEAVASRTAAGRFGPQAQRPPGE